MTEKTERPQPHDRQSAVRISQLVAPFRTHLGARLMAMFVLVALIPMIVVAILSYQRARVSLIDLALSKVEQEAALTAKDMSTYLEQFSADVLALSQSPPVQGIIRARDSGGIDPATSESYESWIDRLRQIFAATARSKEFYQSLSYLDESGAEVVRVDYRDERIIVYSTDDRVRTLEPLQNRAEASYFTQAQRLKPGQVFISPLSLNRKQGEIENPYVPIIHFSTPVYDRSEEFRGVVVSAVYAASFLDRLDVDRGQVYLSNEDGFYLVHPDPTRTFGFELESDYTAAADFSAAYRFLVRSEDDAYTTLDTNRDEVIALQKLYFDPYQAERYWLLIRTLPEDVVMGPVRTLGILVEGVALVVTVVAALLAGGLARSFTRPIRRLTDAAAEIAAGDLTARATVVSDDEVGTLAATFNDMADQLRQTLTRLERRSVQLEVAAQVARDATAAGKLDELLNRAVTLVQEHFGFYHVSLFLMDEWSETVSLRAASGVAGDRLLEQGFRLELGESGIVSRVAHTGRPYVAPDVSSDPLHIRHPLLPETRSEMALPLKVGERVIGVLDVQSRQDAVFDEEDMRILQTMADQLAVALEKMRLFERTQAALEERLEMVVSNLPVVLFALDREGVFTLAEGQGLESLNPEPAELVGRSAFDVWCDLPQTLAAIHRALAGQAFASAIEMNDTMFETRWSPLRDWDDAIIGASVVAIDITERMQAEAEREALIEELEARTAELERFTYTVFHDLKNPLTTIGGFVGFLQQDLMTGNLERMKNDTARIVRATDTMQQLLDDLLELSRIGHLMNPTEEVALGELAHEAVELACAREERYDVEVEIDPELAVVHGDRPRLREVLENLVSNAIRYMGDQSHPHIEIGIRREGGERVFYVQDNGMGIDPRYHEKIFGLFERLDQSVEGTGVGLAIAKRVVEVHGGRIWVESEGIGHGSIFFFTLPDREAKEA